MKYSVCYSIEVRHLNYRNIITGIYKEAISSKYKDQSFWIMCAFVPTFITARFLVRVYPRIFLQVGQHHIHHFTYGIVLLAISGYLGIIRKDRSPIWLAVVFGIGLALAVDETGMWIQLTNHYYNDTSEDAIVVVSTLLINAVYFRDFWLKLIKSFVKPFSRIT